MTPGVEVVEPAVVAAPLIDPATPSWLRPLAWVLAQLNRVMAGLGMLALLAASLILTSSVVMRYYLHASTDWQDEAAVFCLVGATFLCGGFVQNLRGHIGIEAVSQLLSPAINRVRQVLVDLMCLLFCSFFAWKSWTLWYEAWSEGQTTSSTWAPPLWIPYGLMAAGMSILVLQLLVQWITGLNGLLSGRGRA